MQKIWDWIVYSSANADNISLAVKGGIATVVGIILNVIVLGHLQIDPALITTAGGSIGAIIQGFFGVITAMVTLVSLVSGFIGVIRKIILTVQGQNNLLNRFY